MAMHWDSPTRTTNYRDVDGFIYFIQNQSHNVFVPFGAIKIGFTTKPYIRIPNLCRYSSRVITTMRGNMKHDELRLHIEFKESHITGEWFHPSDELVQYIRTLEKLHDVLDLDYGNLVIVEE